MTEFTGSVIESQPDWLSCSAHGTDAAGNLLDLARTLAHVEEDKGNKVKRWRLMGYEGWHVGMIEYGQRDKESTMLRLIGDAAATYLSSALPLADEVTRFDMAVTWRADPPDPTIGPNAYTLAELFHKKKPTSALPQHHADAIGGYTLYLGSRESETFFRLYNKEAESKAKDDKKGAARYAGCWRYEIETKGAKALALASAVEYQENRESYVQRHVYNYCQAHGLEPAFPSFGGRTILPGFRRRSDADTKLRHLAKNVKPTVEWLANLGQLNAALDALGLPHYPEETP